MRFLMYRPWLFKPFFFLIRLTAIQKDTIYLFIIAVICLSVCSNVAPEFE